MSDEPRSRYPSRQRRPPARLVVRVDDNSEVYEVVREPVAYPDSASDSSSEAEEDSDTISEEDEDEDEEMSEGEREALAEFVVDDEDADSIDGDWVPGDDELSDDDETGTDEDIPELVDEVDGDVEEEVDEEADQGEHNSAESIVIVDGDVSINPMTSINIRVPTLHLSLASSDEEEN